MDSNIRTEVHLISDNSVSVYFPEEIDPIINQMINTFIKRFPIGHSDGILDIIPTFHTVHIVFDVLQIEAEKVVQIARNIVDSLHDIEQTIEKEIIEIPVCYESPYALDLDYVCQTNGLSKEEVIKRHTSRDYLIYMIGFTPGFPYLGGMDGSIATPRKAEPRTKLEAGSVGIAGSQTGIYPIESPGGWQIIGKTPVKLFDPDQSNPVRFSAGQYIRFVSISKEEYQRMEGDIYGTY